MKFKFLLPVTVVLCLIFGSYGGDLPSDVKKCKIGDSACIREKIKEIFMKYPKGSPEFGMPNVSALSLQNVTVSRATGSSPIQLNFKFLQLVVNGLENSIVTRISGLDKDIKNVEVDAIIPKLRITGDYVTKGKILILSLDGNGKGEIELTAAKVMVRVKCHLEQRDGKNYVKINKLKAVLEPKKMVAHLQNLVQGNEELTDVINGVINENWSDVWNELKDGINNAVTLIITNLMENILHELAYDDFYSNSS